MKNLLLIGGGLIVGYYLAINKRKQVESALSEAQSKIDELANRLEKELKESDRLAENIVSEDVKR